MKRLLIAMAISPAIHATGNPASFDEFVSENKNWTGIQLYKAEIATGAGNFDDASVHYINAIHTGLSQAANNLALLIKDGKLSEDATLNAVRIVEKLAINDVELSNFLGDFYHTNETHGDHQQAFKWLNNSSRLGDISSKLLVAQYILAEKGGAHKVYTPIDGLTLLREYTTATNDPVVELELGKYLFEGKIVKRDYHLAAELFNKSAESNVLEAHHWLGYQHEHGLGVTKNIKLAEENYLASLGSSTDSDSYYQLSRIYMYGDNGLDGDYLLGVNYLTRSHELGNVKATYRFGIMNLYGSDGFNLDVRSGIKYLDEASEKGYRLATQKLIDVFRTGINGVSPSHSKVREYEKKLAK
ncbi:conserved hypothetical protein [Vibrio chagasii]|nr:conserved hypothetical protein [Vibrio chagasii]